MIRYIAMFLIVGQLCSSANHVDGTGYDLSTFSKDQKLQLTIRNGASALHSYLENRENSEDLKRALAASAQAVRESNAGDLRSYMGIITLLNSCTHRASIQRIIQGKGPESFDSAAFDQRGEHLRMLLARLQEEPRVSRLSPQERELIVLEAQELEIELHSLRVYKAQQQQNSRS